MAVHWSWAFGAETATQISTEMGWAVSDLDPTRNGPTSAAGSTYDYVAYPGTRYAYGTSAVRTFTTPSTAFIPKGWLCVPIKATGGWYGGFNHPLASVRGSGSNKRISVYCHNAITGELMLRFDEFSTGGTTYSLGTFADDQWHYIALRYDMSVANWTAQVYINGVEVLALTASTYAAGVETLGTYTFGGFSNNATIPAAQVGQIIVYDDAALGTGNPYDPIYCTRIPPDTDDSENGPWAPSSGGSAQSNILDDDPLNVATSVESTNASVSDDIIVSVANISTQLGLSSTDVRGVTNHSFSSGTGVDAQAEVQGPGSMTAGTQVTPDTSNTTYAWATDGTQSAAFGAGTVKLKYKIV